MVDAKHTPGPWACVSGGRRGEFTVYLPTDGMVICSRNQYDDKHAEFLANARLIAAAPDMLQALQDALRAMYDRDIDHDISEGNRRSPEQIEDDGDWSEEVYAIRAAIARATGTQADSGESDHG